MTSPKATADRKYPIELLDQLPACGNTWLVLRALDKQGRGIIETDLTDIAFHLDKSVGTIRNHITQGTKLGLYRRVEHISGNLYRFYLANAIKVCKSLGIERSARTVFIGIADIPNRKVIATEVSASVLQNRSEFKAYRVRRQKERIDLTHYLQTSDYCRGKVVWKGARYLFITSKVVDYGGSQSGIGQMIDRSVSTIKRRLSGTHKRQIAIRQDEWSPARLEAAKEHLRWDENLNRFFVHCGYVFKACCNIYQVSQPESNARRWNRRLAVGAE